jgi:hypothetical protein
VQFLISDTFTDSLARLRGEEQKAVKTTAFDLQMDPTQPGLSFHRLDRARDRHFWSVRVNADIRLIVHRTATSLMLCYVDHHDRAYEWAERRKLETHPTTGAAQLVEVRETVKEVVVPVYVDQQLGAPPKPPLFSDRPEQELLAYGVPLEWIDDVRRVDEDALLVLVDRLPAEAAEALLELATGGTPRAVATTAEDPFAHPDAQRRFRILTNVEELERALAFPWEKWTVFLHPDQCQWVEHAFNGPARVSGSAGTGKTIVALHRAVHLARANPDARVLLTTFSETLAHALRTKLRRLVGNEPRLLEHIEVHSVDALGLRLHKALRGPTHLATRDEVHALLTEAAATAEGLRVSVRFVETEWDQVVDAWQLSTWEAYRDVPRMGRKSRLPQAHRETLWGVFESVRQGLERRGLVTQAGMFTALADTLEGGGRPPYDFAVVDEAQDLGVAQLRFLAALAGSKADGLFFAGDLGQRIFQAPYSWMSLGVDIRGRSRTLRVNYRTSHQIRMQADRLLGPEVVDMDGNREDRRGTVSVFNGPPPLVQVFGDEAAEIEAVASWLAERAKEEGQSHALAVFVRSEVELERARAAAEGAGLPFRLLDERVETVAGHVSIGTMHLAKGLEFGAVAVMACDDEVIPLQTRIEEVGDEADLQDTYDTERHLLYVACTRARDHLLVTGVEPGSEFLEDLLS